jgi:hypothetical protein
VSPNKTSHERLSWSRVEAVVLAAVEPTTANVSQVKRESCVRSTGHPACAKCSNVDDNFFPIMIDLNFAAMENYLVEKLVVSDI